MLPENITNELATAIADGIGCIAEDILDGDFATICESHRTVEEITESWFSKTRDLMHLTPNIRKGILSRAPGYKYVPQIVSGVPVYCYRDVQFDCGDTRLEIVITDMGDHRLIWQ